MQSREFDPLFTRQSQEGWIKVNIDWTRNSGTSAAMAEGVIREKEDNHGANVLVRAIKRLLRSDWEVGVVHVYREENKVVDAMLAIGVHMFAQVPQVPNEVCRLVKDDLNSANTPRIIVI
ncbi:hypothetical protein PVK06_007827 [Gossypium arboreum]|uniref:RNase H type-1 domain-containing protein n=1 Tax=Gossypium arboreum TaxID=29729 RepID=A0ABR0QIL4_GOSAR|nr:hypothetical protein PVK06_007827 [Gossypium arboreum]